MNKIKKKTKKNKKCGNVFFFFIGGREGLGGVKTKRILLPQKREIRKNERGGNESLMWLMGGNSHFLSTFLPHVGLLTEGPTPKSDLHLLRTLCIPPFRHTKAGVQQIDMFFCWKIRSKM